MSREAKERLNLETAVGQLNTLAQKVKVSQAAQVNILHAASMKISKRSTAVSRIFD
jgi:hypothetical protein